MISIIPNWHPFLVHFTIVLVFGLAVIQLLNWFFPLAYQKLISSSLHKLLVVITLVSTAATVMAGFSAYHSVMHDAPSHIAMTNHKKWALGTTCVLMFAGMSYFVLPKLRRLLSGSLFVLASVLVMITGFKGSELVYRYGLGVMSLPSSDSHNHDHHKTDTHAHTGEHHLEQTNHTSKHANESQLIEKPQTEHIHEDGKVHVHHH